MNPMWSIAAFDEERRRTIDEPAVGIGNIKPMDVTTAGFFDGSASMAGRAGLASGAQIVQAAKMWGASDETVNAARDWTNQLKPDPTRDGTLSQLIYSLGTVVPQAVLGGVAGFVGTGFNPVGGLTGAIALPSAVQGTMTYDDLIQQGVDKRTSLFGGALTGAVTGLGVGAPASLATKGIIKDLVYTMAANTGLGMAERASMSGVLRANGYNDIADQYDPLDKTAMVADTVLGLAFMGVARRGNQLYVDKHAAAKELEDLIESGNPLEGTQIINSRPGMTDIRTAIEADFEVKGKVLSMMGIPIDGKSAMLGIHTLGDAMEQIFVHGVEPSKVDLSRWEVMTVAAKADGSPIVHPVYEDAAISSRATIEAETKAAKAELEVDPVVAKQNAQASKYSDDDKASLGAMISQIGYAEKGGRIIRDFDTGDVVGRTTWIPKLDWWPHRPKGLTEAQSERAITKAMDGEKLTKREGLLIDYMLEMDALDKSPPDGGRVSDFNPTPEELESVGLEASELSVVDSAQIAKAMDMLGADKVDALATKYDGNYAGFMRTVREAINGRVDDEAPASREADIAAETEATATKLGAETKSEKFSDGKTQEQVMAEKLLSDDPDVMTLDKDGNEIKLADEITRINEELRETEAESIALRDYLLCMGLS